MSKLGLYIAPPVAPIERANIFNNNKGIAVDIIINGIANLIKVNVCAKGNLIAFKSISLNGNFVDISSIMVNSKLCSKPVYIIQRLSL